MKKILRLQYAGSSLFSLAAEDLGSLLIPLPTQDNQIYISAFKTFTDSGIRTYNEFQKTNAYFEHLLKVSEKQEKAERIEDILNIELIEKTRLYHEEQLNALIEADLREVNACFAAKAYKATLILAGSILEAFLIDWVSEIYHDNYFEKDFIVTDKDGKEHSADLFDYINHIEFLNKPSWFDEANKAHEIRKKRNLVHAKLCIESAEINEETCRKVIRYLEDVLSTRSSIQNKNTKKYSSQKKNQSRSPIRK